MLDEWSSKLLSLWKLGFMSCLELNFLDLLVLDSVHFLFSFSVTSWLSLDSKNTFSHLGNKTMFL